MWDKQEKIAYLFVAFAIGAVISKEITVRRLKNKA